MLSHIAKEFIDARIVDTHGHMLVVFGRRSDHGWPTYVNIFNARIVIGSASLRFASNGYKVDNKQINFGNIMFLSSTPCGVRYRDRRANRREYLGVGFSHAHSSFLGNPVTDATSVTSRPAALSALYVPPVDRISALQTPTKALAWS